MQLPHDHDQNGSMRIMNVIPSNITLSLSINVFFILQIYEFLGHLVISYGVAFVTSLAFESPMMGLEKVIFRRNNKKT
jgi:hypothetical protein